MVSRSGVTREFEVHPYTQYIDAVYHPYLSWLKSEGLPILTGHYIRDIRTLELADWPRRGGKGAYFTFSDQRVADGYVCEIPPGGKLNPQRHLYEEIVLVVGGRGATNVWWQPGHEHTFEWQRGSVFSIPLNVNHEHINTSEQEPARFVALTSAPVAFELYRDPAFIFNTDHEFRDRFDPDEKDFFRAPGKYLDDYYGGILHTNLVPDVRNIKIVPRERRGKGNKNRYIHLAGSTMFAHLSEFPVGVYKKAHRHGPGAHVCILDSIGYTMMWRDGEEPQRFDWSEGSVISPAAGQWHQHYNTGNIPCRYIALHASMAVGRSGGGGEQLEYEHQDAKLRDVYVEECRKNGVAVAETQPADNVN